MPQLFAGPLNSDLRRRQSTDYLSPLSTQPPGGDRTRFNHSNTGSGSPMRERFGSYMGKRRESTGDIPRIF
jgi:PERQ amino acid-rich with GYF domain-containing protein